MMTPAFDTVERTLAALHCDIGAAECHGVLSGMLSGGAFEPRLWLLHVSGEDELGDWEGEQAREVFDALARSTAAALRADDFAFDLLLPDDAQAVSIRAEAFASWCRGFLAGIALAGVADLNSLGEDARGFVNDLERFCRLAVGDSEDDGRALEELTEFTRMGVLIVHGELAGAGDSNDEPGLTLH